MQHLYDIPFTAIDRNVVFGALIGVEMLFLMARIRIRGVIILWGILLPAFIAAGVLDAVAAVILNKAHAIYLAPFLQMIVAAAGATGVAALFRHLTKVDIGQDAGLLFFASIAALLMVVPQWGSGNTAPSAVFYSTASLWLGYGAGLACFASLSGRLRALMARSEFAGPFLFLSTLAIAALAVSAVAGLRFGVAP